MPTIQKPASTENKKPGNAATPKSKKKKNSKVAPEDAVDIVARYKELLNAWSTGKFNLARERDEVIAEFFSKDLVYDVTSASGHTGIPEMQKMYCFDDVKDLFDFSCTFDYEGIRNTVVPGSAQNEVWHLLEATVKRKGKSAPISRLTIATFDGGKISKVVQAMHNPGSAAAICSEEDVPFPAEAKIPAFEPHSSPKPVWDAIVALWGTGEFTRPETKQAAIAKHYSTDTVVDASNSAAPEVLKVYYGREGFDEWVDDVWAQTFALSNLGFHTVDLKPGCVLWKMTFDVKHKATGKEAKGGEAYHEVGINTAGQCVYQKCYYVTPEVLAPVAC